MTTRPAAERGTTGEVIPFPKLPVRRHGFLRAAVAPMPIGHDWSGPWYHEAAVAAERPTPFRRNP